MIEQRVNKELNKEQIDLKIASLTLCDNILTIGTAITAVIAFFGILSTFKPDGLLVLKSMLIIPLYKLVLASIFAFIAQQYKKQCLENHKLTKLNNAILLNILTITLMISSAQQICAILSGFYSSGSYSYYIVILVALATLLLLQPNLVLRMTFSMILICSVDFVLHVVIKLLCSVDYDVKKDITVLINSAVAVILATTASYYLATVFHKIFTMYCLREAKLRYYKVIAETDVLTKISNRRAFDLDMDLLSTAHLKNLAIAMFDIDDFKKFNDDYGHATGDYVLEQVGRLISVFNDTKGIEAYRYGGEELVVIFSYIPPNFNIEEQIENFRHAVSEVKIPNVERTITISAGLAYCNISVAKDSDENKQLLIKTCKEADAKLYEAKQTGKNKLCISHIKA